MIVRLLPRYPFGAREPLARYRHPSRTTGELLEAFRECQEGRCTCPTEGYRTVASMRVHADEDRIAIRLTSKPEKRLDSAEIDACLAHTVAKVDDPGRTTETKVRRSPPW